FAVLRPSNDLAKIAFSEVYDVLTRGRQEPHKKDDSASRFMEVGPEPEYHKDVHHFRLRMNKQRERQSRRPDQASVTEVEDETDIEVDDETEKYSRHLGMIWTGCYIFRLDHQPNLPYTGWIMGKGPTEVDPRTHHADLYLCTMEFAKKHVPNLRPRHGRFNFDTTNRAFFMASMVRSALPMLTVNGDSLTGRMYSLNQYHMTVWADTLQYKFEYTQYSSTKEFMQQRVAYMNKQYVNDFLPKPSPTVFEMPTPQRNTRTIGQWSMGKPLGKGAMGRVYLASNTKNEVVAVKMIEITAATAPFVEAEVANFQHLTELGKKYFDGGRIVRLKEKTNVFRGQSFNEIGLIMEPMTPNTVSDLVGGVYNGSNGMSIKAARIFRDALEGVKFLHDHGWIHCDLKPANIGVIGDRAVLLDVGQARYLQPGSMIKASPGSDGTPGYLSPEREQAAYDHSADVWAMGIVGYELTYGFHPFLFRESPWRPGRQYGSLRTAFHSKYRTAI
ncbi:kinase-like protein, partial [Periconia macrospinosa]